MKELLPRNTRAHASVINILLAAGLVFISAGVLLLMYFFSNDHSFSGFWLPSVFFAAGAALVYRSFTRRCNSRVVFAGFFLSIGAILILLSNTPAVPASMAQIWPLFAVICAVSLLCSGAYKYHSLRPRYFIPSLMLCFLGIVFSLFSFDLVTVSFSEFAIQFWPFILIIAGIGLLVLFVYQKKLESFHFDTDENDLFEDDGDDF